MIGNSIANKGFQMKPVVTVGEDFLNSLKQAQKKESKLFNAYFNESEESEIMTKN
jgi:hypothetical protein